MNKYALKSIKNIVVGLTGTYNFLLNFYNLNRKRLKQTYDIHGIMEQCNMIFIKLSRKKK